MATIVSELGGMVFAKYEPQLANDDKQGAAREEKGINVQRLIKGKGAFRDFHPAHEVLIHGDHRTQKAHY